MMSRGTGWAVVFLLAAVGSGCQTPGESQRFRQDHESVKVLVAKRDIPKDTALDETMVEILPIPKIYRQPKALHRIDELLGSVSAATIFAGEQILATKMKSVETGGLAMKIPKNFRGLSIAVEGTIGGAQGVRPGNYVDVIAVSDGTKGAARRSTTLIQNSYVLHVTGAGEGTPQEPGCAGTVTLMLTPEDVQKVALAQAVGTLTVSQRSLWEGNTTVKVSPSSEADVFPKPR